VVEHCLYGVDLSPLAVAVAQATLWLFAGDSGLAIEALAAHLRVGDGLGEHESRFDLVIGNPPWVAFAGRAAQPLPPELRAHYRNRFRSWRGYPTLHGMFVERASEIAADGVIALLVPSPIADLDGYRAVRRAVTEKHRVIEPLLEFGQDAFEQVTQPCFALIAVPVVAGEQSDRRWILAERQRKSGVAQPVRAPAVLAELLKGEQLPPSCFGEMGFQSSRRATTSLLARTPAPTSVHAYPLLEGRDVHEFRVGPTRLFLNAAPERIKWAGCRVRPQTDYARVAFVVRQTAKVPIAARHNGLPFRNSLLAGFEADGLDTELLVGLLNSALYRALHLASQRDARQAVFPQVKIAHLRSLPRPPREHSELHAVRELSRHAATQGGAAAVRLALDHAVFELFDIPSTDRAKVLRFVSERAPELGHR
jgi:hypothetical protein